MTFDQVLSPDFKTHLLEWRREENLTQRAAAARLEVPLKTLIGWEQGQRRPGTKHLSKLAKEFPPSLDEAF